jgi:hypothetical protein
MDVYAEDKEDLGLENLRELLSQPTPRRPTSIVTTAEVPFPAALSGELENMSLEVML